MASQKLSAVALRMVLQESAVQLRCQCHAEDMVTSEQKQPRRCVESALHVHHICDE
jgi:hypothetical protein